MAADGGVQLDGIFLSYARASQSSEQLAVTLHAKLREHAPFLDKYDINPSDEWARAIHTALFSCDAAVILLSPETLTKSSWMAHEAAILLGRFRRWGDITVLPVLTNGMTIELLRTHAGLAGVASTLQAYDACAVPTDRAADEIARLLLKHASKVRRRFMRTRVMNVLVGGSLRADAFQSEMKRLLETYPEPLISAALPAAGLPVPPTNGTIEMHWYAAGLLLTCDPHPLLKSIRETEVASRNGAVEAGSEKAMENIKAFLGERGLAPQGDRFAWSMTRRLLWGLRSTLAVCALVAAILAFALAEVSQEMFPDPTPGAIPRALMLVLPPAIVASVVIAVVFRIARFVAFERRSRER